MDEAGAASHNLPATGIMDPMVGAVGVSGRIAEETRE
jgi:hypothetical protein